MAGEWIKMRIDLATDPAVISIALLLGISEDEVVGKLHRLWSWAGCHTADGNARGVSGAWIDRYLNVTGFADAMARAGWLVASAEGVVFPKWDAHNSQSAKCRLLAAKRTAKSKAKKGNGTTVSETSPEKKREEKNKEDPPTPLGGKSCRLAPSEFLEAWNTFPGFVPCRKLTEQRQRHLRARAGNDDWLASWKDALARAAASPFCTGRGERAWRGDVDWFLRPDTVTKILEGKYDARQNGQTDKQASFLDALEREGIK